MRTAGVLALLVGSLIWLAAILLAPLDGPRTPQANREPTSSRHPLSAATYLAGRFVCHQRPDRSFHLAGHPMPVCARCTGLYAAAPVGAVGALLTTRRRRGAGQRPGHLRASHVRGIVLASATPTAITLAAEWLGFAHPSGTLRALAAVPFGAAAAWIVTHAIRTE